MLQLPGLRVIDAKTTLAGTYLMKPVRTIGGLVKKHFLKPVKTLAEWSSVVDAVLRRVEHQVRVKPAAEELGLFIEECCLL